MTIVSTPDNDAAASPASASAAGTDTLELALARARRQMQVIGEIAQAKEILSGEVEALARLVTESATATLACARCNVWLFDEAETSLTCIDAFSTRTQAHSSGAVLTEAQYGNEFRALKDGPYVAADHPLSDPRTLGYADVYLKPVGISSMLHMVIRISGKNLGLLGFEHVGCEHHWERDEVAFGEQLADKLGLALVSRARQSLEDELRASAARFRVLLDQSPDAIFVYDYDLQRFIDANESAEKLFACPRQQLIDFGPTYFYAPTEGDAATLRASVEERNRRALAGDRPRFDRKIRNAQGQEYLCEVQLTQLPGVEGRRLIRASFVDVTERRTAEARLQFANTVLKSEIESAPYAVAAMDIGTGLASWNLKFENMWKLPSAALESRDPEVLLAAVYAQLRNAEAVREDVMRLRADPGYRIHSELLTLDGRTIEYDASSLLSPAGITLGRISFYRDVTARRRIEQESHQSRQLLEGILNAIPARVFWKSRELAYRGCNRPFAVDAGFEDPAELIGKTDFDMAWRSNAEAYRADDRQVIDSGVAKLLIEEQQTRADGSTGTLLTSKIPLRDALGNIDGVLGVYLDISERKRVDEELRRSAAELREAQRIAQLGSWVWYPDSDRLDLTPELCRIFGLDSAKTSLPLKHFANVLTADSYRVMMAAATRALTELTPYAVDLEYVRPDGARGWLLVRGEAQQDPDGRVGCLRGTAIEITERKLAEQQLRLAQEGLAEAEEIAHVGSWQLDLETHALVWSDEVCRILGFAPASVKPGIKALLARVHPADIDLVSQSLEGAIDRALPFAIDHCVVLPDGTLRTVHHRGRVAPAPGHKHLRLVGTVQDITERKAAEEALAYRDSVLHAVTESSVAFVAAESMAEPFEATLQSIAEVLNLDRLLIIRAPLENAGPVTLLQGWQSPSVPRATNEHIREAMGSVAETWLPLMIARRVLINSVGAATGSLHTMLEQLHVVSNLVVPIVVKGECWGYIAADDCLARRDWSAVEIDALKTLAEVVGALMYREQVRASLQQSEERFRAVSETAQDAIMIIDSVGKIVYWNDAAARSLGYTETEALGMDVRELMASPVEKERAAAGLRKFAATGTGDMLSGVREVTARRKDGSEIPVELSVSAVRLNASWHAVAFMRDITARKQSESYIQHLARHDVLTGLPNRRVFVEALRNAISRATRSTMIFAVLYLDLDHFKDINDTLGHPVGDLVLKEVAQRLLAQARDTDTVARFGGDEFAVLLPNLADPAAAAAFAERVLACIAEPMFLDGNEIRTGTSVGIAIHDMASGDAEILLSQADVALYRAKSEGRGTFRYFTESMNVEVHRRVRLSSELRQALAQHELFLVYQPQVDVDSGRIVGVEALLRWRHAERGMISPAEFIPIAETTGLILAIGEWTLQEACRQGRRWLDAGIAVPLIGVNLSSLQFKTPHVLEAQIATALAETGLSPQCLELELTESGLMDASQEHNDVLIRLRALGVRVALDDFGTGYSSLDYLRRFPVDRIKIAQNFIADVTHNNGDAAIVKAALSLARELHLAVIVEGVETAEQLALLRTWGCREVQGYRYARPMLPDEIAPLLRRGLIELAEGT